MEAFVVGQVGGWPLVEGFAVEILCEGEVSGRCLLCRSRNMSCLTRSLNYPCGVLFSSGECNEG